MAAFNVVSPFEFFTDTDGSGLDNGFIYIGAQNENPEILANQIAVYWDSALTLEAAQPIRTVSGYPSRQGTPSKIYVSQNVYSITVRSESLRFVYSSLSENIGTGVDGFASMEAVRTSLVSLDYIETTSFYAGGTTGGAKLYRDGTGIPTGSGAAVISAALAAGTFCNAAGNCYKLVPDSAVSAHAFGCKIDGTTGDASFAYYAMTSSVPVYFPKGTALLESVLTFTSISNKTWIFHPEFKFLQKSTVTGDIMRMVTCTYINVFDLTLDSDSATSSNVLEINDCSYCNFYGKTTILFSDSISLVLRGGTHHMFFDTILVNDADTRDGVSLLGCHDITINTVIGYANNDDLVTVKAIGGDTYNIQIGKIHSIGAYGAFAIGSAIWEGDVYNIDIGQIVCHNSRRGINLKLYKNSLVSGGVAEPEEPTLYADFGEIHGIHIGSFMSYNDTDDYGTTPIWVDVRDGSNLVDPDDPTGSLLGKIHDITIDHAWMWGAFEGDVVQIQRCKHFNIGWLEIHSYIQATDVRTDVNRVGVYIRNGATDVNIGGGIVEGIVRACIIDASSEAVTIDKVEFAVRDRTTNARLANPTNAAVRLNNCDDVKMRDCDVRSITSLDKQLALDSMAAGSIYEISGWRGRHDPSASAPASGQWYQNEIIPTLRIAASGFMGNVCVTSGAPGTWKTFGPVSA